jgi:hypothetical protein
VPVALCALWRCVPCGAVCQCFLSSPWCLLGPRSGWFSFDVFLLCMFRWGLSWARPASWGSKPAVGWVQSW